MGLSGDPATPDARDDGPVARPGAPRTVPASDTVAPRRGPLGILSLGILLGVPFALFLAVAEDVAEEEVLTWETQILRWAAERRTPLIDALMRVITDLGATVSLSAAAAAIVALLLLKRLHREAVFVALAVGSAALLNALLKQLFQRPRPDVVSPVVTAHGFAFPSGHTMSSMAFACAVTFLCWRLRWRWRWPVSVAAFAFALLVGLSRIYLGVHFPSDVLAGWLISIDLVAVIYLLLFHEARVAARAGPTTTEGGDRGGEA
jgi:membrane-associated phospholipid phosphatase